MHKSTQQKGTRPKNSCKRDGSAKREQLSIREAIAGKTRRVTGAWVESGGELSERQRRGAAQMGAVRVEEGWSRSAKGRSSELSSCSLLVVD
ncbi:hypothetical protein Tco_0654341 [Tanacetum coccineum]|uniref:Uncharacterized protein n=1 Tax=Tanacetum coccineum TaxID=301880 RepID=A0ABQ4X374_9ASTR